MITTKNNAKAITFIVGLVAAGLGFFGGMKYQQSKQPSFARQFGNAQGGRLQTRNGQDTEFRPVSGEIIASDETSLTVKLQDGSSKIVFLSETTQVNKADQATREELTVGTTIAVFGTEGSDGTVTAQNVQINPQQMRIFGGNQEQSRQ